MERERETEKDRERKGNKLIETETGVCSGLG